MSSVLLEVTDLFVRYRDAGGPVVALDGLSFLLGEGETLGILGESGCGKSTLALTLLGLLPETAEVAGGSVRFRGRELLDLREDELQPIRGAEVSLVVQEPGLALHPTRRVGAQLAEVLRAHLPWGRVRCHQEALALLADVGLGEASIADAYPHQLSGGQRQRVVIAQALACRPALVLADEPTAALDATTQRDILEMLSSIRRRLGMAFVLISHDPQVLATMADRLLVMYAGRRVEEGPRDRVLTKPLHPYTEGLLRCLPPAVGEAGHRTELPALPGTAPFLRRTPPGCRFAPRCPVRLPSCDERQPAGLAFEGRYVECLRHEE